MRCDVIPHLNDFRALTSISYHAMAHHAELRDLCATPSPDELSVTRIFRGAHVHRRHLLTQSNTPFCYPMDTNNFGEAQISSPRAAFWALRTLDLDLDLEMRGCVLFVGRNVRLAPPDATQSSAPTNKRLMGDPKRAGQDASSR